MIGWLAFIAYAACVPLANWMIQNIGSCVPNGPCLVPVGFGFMAPSGVLLVGAALVLRDVVHNYMGTRAALIAVGVGTLLAAVFAPPMLVVASASAFLLSELADLSIYAPLRKRSLTKAVLASGFLGAVVDSAVFLWVAFGSLAYIEGQILGKLWMSAGAVIVMVIYRKALEGK